MKRLVAPEILDSLPAEDPRAVRSRRDLRLINRFMRGEAWILSQLAQLNPTQVVELGAGEGWLVDAVKRRFPSAQVVGVDLVSRPSTVQSGVEWHAGDIFAYEGFDADTVVVANLFVHHLSEADLRRLAEKLSGVRAILFAEPYRGRIPMGMGRVLFPFINEVTRHDMLMSIQAGFRAGELGAVFGVESRCSEERGVFGGIRFRAVRA